MSNRVVCMPIFAIALLVTCSARQGIATGSSRESQKPSNVKFEGKSGKSYEDAIIIRNAKDQHEGVRAEYRFISVIHGKKDKDWRLKGQTTARENGSVYDIVEIESLSTGETHYYYFDISDCSWKPSH